MFGWFAPKCPLDLSQKVWIEFRMRWLADHLGIERLLKAEAVTPETQFFEGDFQGSEPEMRALMVRLAGMMGIAPPPELEFLSAAEMEEASGRYIQGPPPRIQLNLAKLSNAESAILIVMRLLAQHLLLGREMVDPNAADQEHILDLLLIFVGAGTLAVNYAIDHKADRPGTASREMHKIGPLAPMDLGYALALFAYVRGEDMPLWAGQLQTDAADVMKRGLRFLHKTGDTIFHPDRVREKLRPPTVAEARDRLTGGTPSEQLLTLWQLNSDPLRDATVIELITVRLADRHMAIASAAASALQALGEAAAASVPALLKALDSSYPRVRASAASAVGAIRAEPEKAVLALTALLGDTNPSVLAATAHALAQFDAQAGNSVLPLLHAIDAALYRHPSEPSVPFLVLGLMKIDPDPDERVRAFYENGNDEHRDFLLALMRDFRKEKTELEDEEAPADDEVDE